MFTVRQSKTDSKIVTRSKVIGALFGALALSTSAVPLQAQQREIVNQGFELYSPQRNAPSPQYIGSDSRIVGWRSTNGRIEPWRTGFLGVPAQEGSYFLELNVSSPTGVYQEVCLHNGEQLNWSFGHRARSGGGSAIQNLGYEVATLTGANVQTLGTSSAPRNNTWQSNAGTAVFNGATGTYRLQFRSLNSASYGNFLDNIELDLVAYAELSADTGADAEDSGRNMIALRISGDVVSEQNIPFSIVGGSATVGDDFTVDSSTITVPIGTYDGVSASSFIPLPITIINDSVDVVDETIEIQLGAFSSSSLQVASIACGTAPLVEAVYTITNDDIPPVAGDDGVTGVGLGTTAVITNIRDNDRDIDGTLANDTVNLIPPSGVTPQNIITDINGDVTSFLVPNEGTWTYDPVSGNVTFEPLPTFAGSPNSITYTIDDTSGVMSPEATISAAYVAAVPGIELIKSVSSVEDTNMSGVFGDAGDTVNYLFMAANTGNTALGGITVSDADLVALVGASTPPTQLAAFDGNLAIGEGLVTPVEIATASYVLDVTDIANGGVTNTADVTATAVARDVFGNPLPLVELDDVDPATDRSDSGSEPAIDQTDGDTTDIADPSGTNSDGTPGNDTEEPTVLALSAMTAQVSLVKTGVASVDRGQNTSVTDAGDVITYTLVATNDGDLTLTNVAITSDTLSLGADGSGAETDLTSAVTFVSSSGADPLINTIAPGESATFTAQYVILDAAAEAGGVSNSAVVSGQLPSGMIITGATSAPAVTTVQPSVDIEVIEEILSNDLLLTTAILSSNASAISRGAADRLRTSHGQACGQAINDVLQANPVRFASDSYFIDAGNSAVLDEITRILGQCAGSSFLIAGHTDSDASDAYNTVLSQNRVDAVRDALAMRGVSVDRLQTQGFGESRPIATNATEEGQALNRRVEFIQLDADVEAAPGCGEANNTNRTLNGAANEQGASLNGNFASSGYDCVTGTYSEFWSELNVTHDDDSGTLGVLSFGGLRERQANNALFGQFVEGYVSKYDVVRDDAEGTINGVGIHAGVYGAHGAESGLILSYYGSAAVGRHAFEINAGDDADGSYTYAGVFVGGAIGGEQTLDNLTIKPRVGLDLAYAETIGSEISVADVELDIDPATYARGFVELGISRSMDRGTFDFTPRLFCSVNGNASANDCGLGASFNYATLVDAEGAQWDMTFDYEQMSNRQSASIAVARSQIIFDDLGVSKSSFRATRTGALQAEQTVEFAW